MGFPGGSDSKESAFNVGDLGSIPGLGRSLGEGNGNPLWHSHLWTEEPGELQSMGLQTVGHDWMTNTFTFVSQLSSVAQSCPTLCDPMDCSRLGVPVHHQLPEPMSIESVMPSTISSSVIPFSHFQSFPASRSFQMSQLFASGGQSTGVSASASVLPMNIQDWFL